MNDNAQSQATPPSDALHTSGVTTDPAFHSPKPTWKEAERLTALDRYAILDTGRETAFDDVASLAADILDAPIAVVNLIAADRQWFKAEIGIGTDTLPLDVSICRHAILQPGVFVVPDLSKDARFENNPLVHVAEGLRFYAGALLETPDGLPLGTVCVLDTKARPGGISERQERALKVLAAQTMARLELRRSEAIARAERARAEEHARRLSLLSEASSLLLATSNPVGSLRDLFSLVAEKIRIDFTFHYRCGGGALQLVAAAGLTPEQELAAARIEFGQTVCGIVAATREAAYFTGIQSSEGPHVQIARTLGIESYFSLPLLSGDNLLGTLSFGRKDEPFSFGELETLRTLAAQLATALERRQAEADLRASEAELRFALKAGRFGAWSLDLASGELTTSDTCRANFGRDQIAPFTCADLNDAVHPDDKTRMAEAVEHSVATNIDYDIEYRIITPAGETRWVAIRAQPSYAPDGTPLGWAGVSMDVTERKQTEEALRALNLDLERQVIERTQARGRSWAVSPDLMGALNAEGFFETSNPAWRTVLGWSEDEVQRMPIWDMLHPDDLKSTQEGFALTQSGQSAVQFPNRYRCKDGTYRWISWIGVPEDGLVYCTGRDITEQRAQAAAFAERTAERDRVWTGSRDILVVTDADGVFQAVNPAWTRILGHEAEEVLGRSFREFVWPEDLGVTTGAVEAAGSGIDVEGFQNRYRAKDGAPRWIVWRTTFENGQIYGYGRDITAEREREAELAQAQEALRQSQKMEAMGQLTGGVAHDFNNLLTPIVGALDMLQRRGVGGEREQRLIGGAVQSAERAKVLVQRLLAFARRQPLQVTAVDVGRLISDMADLVSSTTGPQIKVAVEIPRDLPPAIADSNQLEMALLNLSVNARDAMPEGGTLRISATSEVVHAGWEAGLKAGAYVKLSVADTGVGMDEATLARATEPFFSTKGVGKGTGLGLSMVHGLASQLGGALHINSRPGLGTNIELWLPQSLATFSTPEQAPPILPAPDARGLALLVDDEELVRISTADMLSDLGYSVVEAGSAEEALRLFDDGLRPNVLVTDHLMPGMSGTELARALKARSAALPALIVSGYAESEGVAPDLPRLTKPFRNDDLAAALAALAIAK